MNDSATKHDIRIAYIGGGSRGWAHTLMRDLALAGDLTGEIRLYDIDLEAARFNEKVADELYSHPDALTTFKVRAVEKPRDALRDADFVVMSILPGPMTMFANDLDIPLKYGIIQTVGDTTGPGGISRALRTVPIYIEYAHLVMEHCPDAWVINYTNPMTLCTRALYAVEPGIKAFGCCHEVFGTQGFCANLYHKVTGEPQPHRKEIAVDVAGVNHFTHFTRARHRDVDLFPIIREYVETSDIFRDHTADALEYQKQGRVGSSFGLVQLDFLRRFGAMGAAGDRHLVEFVPWYLRDLDTLHRWGVSVTTSAHRLRKWRPSEQRTNADLVEGWERAKTKLKEKGLTRSKEEGVDQIRALLGLEDLDTNVNLPNSGQLEGLPAGAVVETNAAFRNDSVAPVAPHAMPDGLRALVAKVVHVQELTLRAALDVDYDLALQALLADPLCTISTDKADAMLREMIEANRAMLRDWPPQ